MRNCTGTGLQITPETGTGQKDLDDLHGVRQLHHENVVLAQAGVEERRSQIVHLRHQLAIGEPPRLSGNELGPIGRVDQRLGVRGQRCCIADQVHQRLFAPDTGSGVLSD